MSRLGLPGYSQAGQLVVLPFCCPRRTAASQELLRTLPVQLKLNVWLCGAPFEARSIVQVVLLSNGRFAPPELPVFAPPKNPVTEPLVQAMFVEPLTPLIVARPAQFSASLRTWAMPVIRG
jgi:hypothetical protein